MTTIKNVSGVTKPQLQFPTMMQLEIESSFYPSLLFSGSSWTCSSFRYLSLHPPAARRHRPHRSKPWKCIYSHSFGSHLGSFQHIRSFSHIPIFSSSRLYLFGCWASHKRHVCWYRGWLLLSQALSSQRQWSSEQLLSFAQTKNWCDSTAQGTDWY